MNLGSGMVERGRLIWRRVLRFAGLRVSLSGFWFYDQRNIMINVGFQLFIHQKLVSLFDRIRD